MGLVTWFARNRPTLADQFAGEGVVLIETGVGASVTYRNYRAPGQRSAYERRAIHVGIVLTEKGLHVTSGHRIYVDVDWSDGTHVTALRASVDDKGRLVISFDAAKFHDDRSGTIEIHARAADPQRVVEVIDSHRP